MKISAGEWTETAGIDDIFNFIQIRNACLTHIYTTY